MISHNLKFIFIHIPKTSGNSLSLLLKNFIDNVVIQRASRMGEKQGIDILCEKTKKDIKHKKVAWWSIKGTPLTGYARVRKLNVSIIE